MATYLVTGATGLIGRHFVAELLARPDTDRVWLLVRERSQDRLAAVARDWPAPEKIETLLGDVREERLGISDEQVAELTGTIDNLVHLAALYDIAADDDASIAANVDGTRHMLDLAAAIEVGCLHHVSSVAVAGDYRGRFTEEMFDAGQRLRHALPPDQVRVGTPGQDADRRAVAGLPAGDRGRQLGHRRDGQDRRAVLLLQRARAAVVGAERAAGVPGHRRHEHRAGRLRRGGDGRAGHHAGTGRPRVPPGQPGAAVGAQRVQRVRAGGRRAGRGRGARRPFREPADRAW